MFKFLPYYEKSSFVKRKKKLHIIKIRKNIIFTKKINIFHKKIILVALKYLLKQVKKKKYVFFINLRFNFIKSFKSKNARMGKGKGIFTNHLINNKKHNIFTFSKISTGRRIKLVKFFKNKSIIFS